MRKHVMAMTYEPKKEAVFDGRCTQTIRKGDKVSIGDEILFMIGRDVRIGLSGCSESE